MREGSSTGLATGSEEAYPGFEVAEWVQKFAGLTSQLPPKIALKATYSAMP